MKNLDLVKRHAAYLEECKRFAQQVEEIADGTKLPNFMDSFNKEVAKHRKNLARIDAMGEEPASTDQEWWVEMELHFDFTSMGELDRTEAMKRVRYKLMHLVDVLPYEEFVKYVGHFSVHGSNGESAYEGNGEDLA